VIHYHGTPITPDTCAIEVVKSRHAFVSWATAQQIRLVAEHSQSFAIDNGAFIFWKNGVKPDWPLFYWWLEEWLHHPRLDFVVIPDVIGGTEEQNDQLIAEWPHGAHKGAPVWHTNESLERLQRLARDFPRVCIGSSGEFDVSLRSKYLDHVGRAIRSICNYEGYPITKIHLLRGLNPAIFTQLPVSSADSTNVARNIGIDSAWKGTYQPRSKQVRARILVDRIEYHNSLCRFDTGRRS
jgi:hypothetical protein